MSRLALIALGAAAAVGLAVGVAAVGGDDGVPEPERTAVGGGRRDETRAAGTRRSSTTSTTRPRRGSGQPVTMVFGGDVHFEGSLRSQLDADPTGMLMPIAEVFGAADVAMVNLETAIATGGIPDRKAYNFRAPAGAFAALTAAGVDAVSMANNHGRDFGPEGLAETLAAKQQTPLHVLGIGANAAEAYRPWELTVRGQRIALFAASDVVDDWLIEPWSATATQPGIATTKPGGVEQTVAAIREVRARSDTVVVFLHWGPEPAECPSPRQQELAAILAAAGADVVIGSATHRIMGAGRLGDAFVAYGLGNFVFYNEAGPSGVSGALRLTVTGREVDGYEWLPARIRGGIPRWLAGDEAAADRAVFEQRRSCTGLTP